MHEFFEESFNLENTFEDILSIQVSLNGFSFSIVRSSDRKVLVFKKTPLKISSPGLIARRFKEWFQSEEILQKPFQKTRIIVFSEKFTLVPDSVFSNEAKEELTYVLFNKGDKLNFAENHVKTLGAKLLFSLPEGLNESILETLGESSIIHPIKSILNGLLDSNGQNQLILLFNGNDLYLLLQNNNQAKLVNSFNIKHANDVVYFVLSTLKQLRISLKSTALLFAGESDFIGETEKNLQKYFASTDKFLPSNTHLPEETLVENISLFLE